jgi:hypothetical protein
MKRIGWDLVRNHYARAALGGQDARNRQLGKLGEEFVVLVERHHLRTAGRDDLAAKVQRVTERYGDGLGFDVLSYDDADDAERLVEVKTTALGKFHPFLVTANAVRCSEDMTERLHLFRVFDFGRTPRVYVLTGSLRTTCTLESVVFRASL